MKYLPKIPVLLVLVGGLLGPGSARGQAIDLFGDFEVFGQWRYLASHAQDFPLNEGGEASGLNFYLDQRLLIGTVQQVTRTLEFTGELEIFYGQVYGDTDAVGVDLREDERVTLRGWDLKRADLRQLWVRWNAPYFQLRAGQMGSHWGLGLLANDGREQPGRFGFPDRGDFSDRLLVATRPFDSFGGWAQKIVAAAAVGLVYRDENASLRDGDLGTEMLASMFYDNEGIRVGIYAAGRIQNDEAGTSLNVAAIDLFGSVDAGEGHQGLLAQTELSFITGSTDRVIHAAHPEGVDILALGAVARAGWRFCFWEFLPMLEFGYASGDPDTNDDTVTAFSFDPDYKVGLVLFDSVLRGVTAMAAQEAADPERIGEPLPGTDMLASQGRVTNAVYLNPTVTVKPLEQLTLMAGFLYAWSAVPFAQTYQTFKHGGVATNPYGLTNPGRDLGWELDLGVDWNQEIWGRLHLLAGFQAGWFSPGSAFERPDGTRPGLMLRLIGRAALAW